MIDVVLDTSREIKSFTFQVIPEKKSKIIGVGFQLQLRIRIYFVQGSVQSEQSP